GDPRRRTQRQDPRNYDAVWRLYLRPTLGHLTLPRLMVEIVRQMKRDIPALVVKQRLEASSGGKHGQRGPPAALYRPRLRLPHGMGVTQRGLLPSRAEVREAEE